MTALHWSLSPPSSRDRTVTVFTMSLPAKLSVLTSMCVISVVWSAEQLGGECFKAEKKLRKSTASSTASPIHLGTAEELRSGLLCQWH